MSMCLCRHHLWGPGNAENAVAIASPHQWRNRHYTMPQKGSNYRTDGRLLYKCEAADRPGRALLMPGFKQVPAGSSYSRITKGRLSQKHRHISTSDAGENKGRNTGYWLFFFGVCADCFGVSNDQKGTEIRAQSWQIMQKSSPILLSVTWKHEILELILQLNRQETLAISRNWKM